MKSKIKKINVKNYQSNSEVFVEDCCGNSYHLDSIDSKVSVRDLYSRLNSDIRISYRLCREIVKTCQFAKYWR